MQASAVKIHSMMGILILRRKVCDTDAGSHDHAQLPRRILMVAVPQTQGVIGPERQEEREISGSLCCLSIPEKCSFLRHTWLVISRCGYSSFSFASSHRLSV